jgi:hypothetical protein
MQISFLPQTANDKLSFVLARPTFVLANESRGVGIFFALGADATSDSFAFFASPFFSAFPISLFPWEF